jgi:hypothetical protein
LAEEINRSCITYNKYEVTENKNAIEVVDGNFYWDKETEEEGVVAPEPTLNLYDINFTLGKG